MYRVYPMLSVSLDCQFLISPSIFSNVYLTRSIKLVDPIYILLKCLYEAWNVSCYVLDFCDFASFYDFFLLNY